MRAREALRQMEAMRDISEHAAGIGSFRWPLDGTLASWSKEVYALFDVMPGEFGFDLPRAVAARVLPDDQGPLMAMLHEVAERGELMSMEIRVRARGGERVMRVGGVPEYDDDGLAVAVAGYVQDVTASKQTETLLSVPSEFLAILGEGGHVEEMARKIVSAIQRASGFSAVGLRLRDGDDYPFIAATGYEAGFIEAEDSLTSPAPDGGLCREEDGSISLECTCGLVIRGPKTPGDPLFTPGGSVWTNDGKAAVGGAAATTTPGCVRATAASTWASAPSRSCRCAPVDQTLGLLHLADNRTGCFTPESIRLLRGARRQYRERPAPPAGGGAPRGERRGTPRPAVRHGQGDGRHRGLAGPVHGRARAPGHAAGAGDGRASSGMDEERREGIAWPARSTTSARSPSRRRSSPSRRD